MMSGVRGWGVGGWGGGLGGRSWGQAIRPDYKWWVLVIDDEAW